MALTPEDRATRDAIHRQHRQQANDVLNIRMSAEDRRIQLGRNKEAANQQLSLDPPPYSTGRGADTAWCL